MGEKKFTHIDDTGKANMVDVGNKPEQRRTAVASGFIKLKAETLKMVSENQMKKGDVLTVAEIAGIQAVKRTSDLIPLCHPLLINKAEVKTFVESDGIKVTCTVKCNGQTGVEMEALTGVSVALLTIYDMCKAIDKEMEMGQIVLEDKKKE